MEYITKMLKRTAALDVAAAGLVIANQNHSGQSRLSLTTYFRKHAK
jgi:hypothetical protein